MKVDDVVFAGGGESKGVCLRVYRNEQFYWNVADPAGWRLVSDLACADESKRDAGGFAPRWRAPDFDVAPGGLYCLLMCDGDGRPLALMYPEGIAVPEGVERMSLAEWAVWHERGGQ